MSVCMLPWVYCHNIPSPTPLRGKHSATKATKAATDNVTTKMLENCTLALISLLTKPNGAVTQKCFSETSERFVIFIFCTTKSQVWCEKKKHVAFCHLCRLVWF